MSVGYIYILSHPKMPSLLKIGYTTRENVSERVKELSSPTGVPGPFIIEYYCLTRKVEEVESSIHKLFESARTKGTEFFEISITRAIMGIEALIEDVKPDRFINQQLKPTNQDGVQSVVVAPIESNEMRLLKCKTCKHEWKVSIYTKNDTPCPACGWHISERINKKTKR